MPNALSAPHDESLPTEINDASLSDWTTKGSDGGASTATSRGSNPPMDAAAMTALQARRLDPEIAAALGWTGCGRLGAGSIAIPFVDNGVTVNHKRRTLDAAKRMQMDPGAPLIFWNVDCLRDPTLVDQPLIITEGEMDALAAIQAGFRRVVSVPNGAPAQASGDAKGAQRYQFVEHAEGLLRDVGTIILATDGDAAGEALRTDLAEVLGRARCKAIRYPVGCKDLGEALERYGDKGVQQSIGRAVWLAVPGVYRMSELAPVEHRRSYECTIPGLENRIKLRMGDLTVVTGIPGHGKSTFINDLCAGMAMCYGLGTCFASFEQNPQVDHRRALRTWYGTKPAREQTEDELAAADAWIDQNFSFLVPSDDDLVDLEWTLDRCAVAVRRYGAKIVAIDPWNEMDHRRPGEMSLTEYTGFAIKQFKMFARRMSVHMMVAAHPSKQRKLDSGIFAVPSMYDISDSAHWYNKPDLGIIIHRESATRTLIRNAKSRYHDSIGEPGDESAMFNRDTGRYMVVPGDEK